MEAVDESTGEDLVRRPDHTILLGGSWQIHPALLTTLRLRRIGARLDIDLSDPFDPAVVELAPVLLVDGEVGWRMSDSLSLRVMLRNLTDASPVWVWGYGSRGRSLHFGMIIGGREAP